jgi:F420-dependent oxidoreductase-like protein
VSTLNLPSPCVVVLVGPGASGKSTWAAEHFAPEYVVGSDQLRALVGAGEDDLAASADAFAILEDVVARRLARRLTTVIDTLGLDPERRRRWRELAERNGMPYVAVAFTTPAKTCRERNRGRAKRIPADVLAGQLRAWAATRDLLAEEGPVIEAQPVRVVPEAFAAAAGQVEPAPGALAGAGLAEPTGPSLGAPTALRFGLHLGQFAFTGDTAIAIRDIAVAAERAGFDAIYVMDHFRQIPQIGRAWDDFLESYTTLAYLAACTERVRLGALVTGVTYRNVAHLGKIIATLDVLSRGRAVCGLGLAWFEQEHKAYGWPFPTVASRYALLEDALRVLPMLWGKGSPRFDGAVITVPETLCYPRPRQAHVPIVLGGGGERRTLRLAARYADAANVFGDLATVRRKASILQRYSAEHGRTVDLTHLSTVLVGDDDKHVRELVDRHRRRGQDPARYAAEVNAGTVDDQIARFRQLAEAGVAEVMLRLADLTEPAPLERMAKVIAAFR